MTAALVGVAALTLGFLVGLRVGGAVVALDIAASLRRVSVRLDATGDHIKAAALRAAADTINPRPEATP